MFNQKSLLSWAISCQVLKVKLIHMVVGKVRDHQLQSSKFLFLKSGLSKLLHISASEVSNSATCKMNTTVCDKQTFRSLIKKPLPQVKCQTHESTL